MTEPMPDFQTLKPVGPAAGPLPLFARRIVDEALSVARPGGVVLIEGPTGAGKSSAVAASVYAPDAIVVDADSMSDADIDALSSANAPVLLTASGADARLRLLARGVSPVVVGPDELRFDLTELGHAADLASVRLSRRQLVALAARTEGRPALVARVLGALPRHVAVTDAAVDAAWSGLTELVTAEFAERFGVSWDAVGALVGEVPVLTDPMRAHLMAVDPAAETIIAELTRSGLAGATNTYGETVIALRGIRPAARERADAAWLALATAEYRRIGADLELAIMLADAEEWSALRDLFRRRHAELFRTPDRSSELIARIPSALFGQDAWLIVVERMLGVVSGAPVPPRRLRKPSGAMPPIERAWLQAGKLRLEIADGSFSKSVAEATYLTRILDQADLPDDEAAELWLQSALPPFHTGNYAESCQRLAAAIGHAERGDRPHVELSATGLAALCHALRGDIAGAAAVLDRLCPVLFDEFAGSTWGVPALIAAALVAAERGDVEAATRAVDGVRYDRLGAFWALYGAVAGRVALDGAPADVSLDHLRVIEQFAGDIPASNHDRGLFAASVSTLQFAAGRVEAAAASLSGFDDGRESTLLASTLAELASGGPAAALDRLERIEGKRVTPLTRVGAAAIRLALSSDDDRDAIAARLDALAERCGLERFAALVAGAAAR